MYYNVFAINKACNLCPILGTLEIPKMVKKHFLKFNDRDFPFYCALHRTLPNLTF
jgi:hypothetical protein